MTGTGASVAAYHHRRQAKGGLPPGMTCPSRHVARHISTIQDGRLNYSSWSAAGWTASPESRPRQGRQPADGGLGLVVPAPFLNSHLASPIFACEELFRPETGKTQPRHVSINKQAIPPWSTSCLPNPSANARGASMDIQVPQPVAPANITTGECDSVPLLRYGRKPG